jgi:hypothetical protein
MGWRIHVFGFHLGPIDLRQNADVHGKLNVRHQSVKIRSELRTSTSAMK